MNGFCGGVPKIGSIFGAICISPMESSLHFWSAPFIVQFPTMPATEPVGPNVAGDKAFNLGKNLGKNALTSRETTAICLPKFLMTFIEQLSGEKIYGIL